MAKIMVVDDSEDLVDSIAIYLEKEGNKIVPVYRGEEAISLAPIEKPDLIILDVNLPGLDGFEVARRLRSHRLTAGIPIIFLTVRSELKDRLRGLSYGALDYITKPFSMEDLGRRVEEALRKVRETKRKVRWRRARR
ncbi:MAG TPA: response regulator [bacterium]|nr:response regulator [bacterium]HEX68278.1 response regulator [bacterium]